MVGGVRKVSYCQHSTIFLFFTVLHFSIFPFFQFFIFPFFLVLFFCFFFYFLFPFLFFFFQSSEQTPQPEVRIVKMAFFFCENSILGPR